jgi:hypothetical protein
MSIAQQAHAPAKQGVFSPRPDPANPREEVQRATVFITQDGLANGCTIAEMQVRDGLALGKVKGVFRILKAANGQFAASKEEAMAQVAAKLDIRRAAIAVEQRRLDEVAGLLARDVLPMAPGGETDPV